MEFWIQGQRRVDGTGLDLHVQIEVMNQAGFGAACLELIKRNTKGVGAGSIAVDSWEMLVVSFVVYIFQQDLSAGRALLALRAVDYRRDVFWRLSPFGGRRFGRHLQAESGRRYHCCDVPSVWNFGFRGFALPRIFFHCKVQGSA